MIKFWKEEGGKKTVDPELFDRHAEDLAKRVYEGQARTRGKANKPTQLRKFFDEVVRIDGQIRARTTGPEQDQEFLEQLPYLKMLNAKAAYAEARELITREFRELLSESLKQVKTRQDFRMLVSFFEAFMGFYKFHDKSGQRGQEA